MKISGALVVLPLFGLSTALWAAEAQVTLKDAAQGHFLIGAAVNVGQIMEVDRPGLVVLKSDFNSITPENVMKWENIHPKPDRYAFEMADSYVDFGVKHGMFVIGHTLMWHHQTPDWVFQDSAGQDPSKEFLLQRLHSHIEAVVGRYKGKVKGWDVVNEAIGDDGRLRTDKTWYRILGVEGIYAAFQAAHDADPDAELYYNDYALENPVKRAGVLQLVREIRAQGYRIDGVGTQEHNTMEWPTAAQVDEMIGDFSRAGFKMMVTELDVTVLPRPAQDFGADLSKTAAASAELNPYKGGLPADQQEALARRYGELFTAYARRAGAVTRVTLWGVGDGSSWLNAWPIKGRTDYPLLYDRAYKAKPAHAAVVAALQAAPAR